MTTQCETGVTRKKLENYSYNMSSNIGKGYSSQVFKGKNDITSIRFTIQINTSQSKSST